jgi:hypothetical protein
VGIVAAMDVNIVRTGQMHKKETPNLRKGNLMKKTNRFLGLALVFSTGIFLGELLIDFILKYERDSLKVEILQALFIGLFVSLIFILVFKKSERKE